MPKKQNVQKTLSTKHNKIFSYVRGGVSLEFTLNDDHPQQMLDFIEILTEAKKDVEEAIAEMKN